MTSAKAWPFSARAKFILEYGLSKLLVPFWLRSSHLQHWLFEWRYSLTNLINTLRPDTCKPVFSNLNFLKTNAGDFRIRPGTQDAALISPAFEWQDFEKLKKVLDAESKSGSFIHFLDIGANIGAFTVRVAKRFPLVSIHAFEPIPENRALLNENIKANGLRTVEVYPIALSDRATELKFVGTIERAGQFGVRAAQEGDTQINVLAQSGDDVLKSLPSDAVLVVKIDVEGHEFEVLKGLKQRFAQQTRIWLVIEDIFRRDELYALLEQMGFQFRFKLTPYNSWWFKCLTGPT